jgi:SAM-dependent methyltransferase
MKETPFRDLFSGHAPDYAAFRPTYPEHLFVYLSSLTGAHGLAWDCATGNGQTALGLASSFDAVLATDASARQLAQAVAHERVRYGIALAERSPLPDGSVDLVTVSQALHWLKLPAFYAEVRRVARPGGVIACWCYSEMQVAPQIDPILSRLDNEVLHDDWLPEHFAVARGYAGLAFPFEEITPPAFSMTKTWDLERLMGFLNTWSSARRYRERTGLDPVDAIGAELTAAWGEPDEARVVTWPLHLRVGRVRQIEQHLRNQSE